MFEKRGQSPIQYVIVVLVIIALVGSWMAYSKSGVGEEKKGVTKEEVQSAVEDALADLETGATMENVETVAEGQKNQSNLVIDGDAVEKDASIETYTWGTTEEGTTAHLYVLRNNNGVWMNMSDYGARIIDIYAPDRNGDYADISLSHDTIPRVHDGNSYMGATIGRYANRIDNGRFTIDGQTYQVLRNNLGNHLHGGGERSFDSVVWDAQTTMTDDGPAVEFTYTSPAGEEDYPGELTATVTYTLTNNNNIRMEFTANVTKDCPVNLTNHVYFNLSGQGNGQIRNQIMKVNAEYYTPGTSQLIPTGEIKHVSESEKDALDFTEPKLIGKGVGPLDDAAGFLGVDHNFVLRKSNEEADEPKFAARVYDPETGRVLEVYTTSPGIQIYTGNFLGGQKGEGVTYEDTGSISLEGQYFPNSPNVEDWKEPAILRPDETFNRTMIYKLRTSGAMVPTGMFQ